MSTELTRYTPPALSPALRQAVARLMTSPEPRKWPGVGEDDPGFVVANQPPPPSTVWVEGADRAAAEYAASACAAADPRTVHQWLQMLARVVTNPPSAQTVKEAAQGICFAFDDIPAGCWQDHTLREAIKAFKFWPAPAEIHAMLKPHAVVISETARALHDIARTPKNAPPSVEYGAFESTEPYQLPPPPPERPSRVRISAAERDDMAPRNDHIQPPVRTVAEQLAALGFQSDGKTPL